MRFIFFFVLHLLCRSSWGKSIKVYYNVTDEEYDRMPTLFELDNFDECMNLKNPLYCFVTVQLSPVNKQEPSETWNIIKEVISVNRTYRHDWLRHGICVPKSCPKIPIKLYASENGTEALRDRISLHYTEKYESSGLRGTVEKMHCQNGIFAQVDSVDIIYAICIGVWLLIIATSTIYDALTRYKPSKVNDQSKIGRFLTSLSIIRSWERLRAESKSPDAKPLQVIQGIRVYNLFFVVMSHSVMTVLIGPLYNPRFLEDVTLSLSNMYLTNGTLIIQTSFLLSGWFLSYNLCMAFEEKKIKPGHLLVACVNRLIRLLPVMVVAVGFSATWLRHLGNGPVWDRFAGEEFRNCRKNWFAVFLFMNNYYEPHEMCLQQTWSMSVDTQCFIISLVIMMLVLNNRHHANKIFVFFITLGLVMSFAHNAHFGTDIVYRSYPEILYTLYLNYEQWLSTLISTDMAVPCYVQGLMFGYYFRKYRKEDKKIVLNKFWQILWYVFIWTVPNFTILSAGYFYSDGATFTDMQAIVYQSLNRSIFGFSIGVVIFGMTMGIGGKMISAVTWPPLQTIARASFSIYLVHVWHMRIFNGVLRTPFYVTYPSMIERVLPDFFISVILGIVACLVFEMPVSALQKLVMSPDRGKVEEKKKKEQ